MRLGRALLTLAALAPALLFAVPTPARAGGPPFLTDDPQPIDYRHDELYVFTTWDVGGGGSTTTGPALEFNAGILPNVMTHIVFPWENVATQGLPNASGYGDTEIGVKYRFLQETPHVPMLGIFPMAELATGNPSNGLGNGVTWYRLPLWAQKSWGSWTVDGGGGWALNAASGMRNYPFAGILVLRDLSPAFSVGAEVFTQGASGIAPPNAAYTVYNIGGYYQPTQQFNALFSIGHSFIGASHAIGYFGLYYTFPKPSP